MLREIELLVRAGFTPREAIIASTSDAAKVLGLDAEAGAVRPELRADLLVVEGDPLRKIGDLRRSRWVVTAGDVYRTADLWAIAGFRPD